MGVVRGLSIMRVKTDYESAVGVAQRSCEVAKSLDGVLSWEMFGDEESGMVVLSESWESEDALVGYEQAITAAGLRPEIEAAFSLEFDFALTPIEDPQIATLMREFGSIQTSAMASK